MYNSEMYKTDDWIKINDDDLRIYPNDPEFINFRGLIHFEKDEYDDALKYFSHAITKQPSNVNYIRNKALTYIEMKSYELAHKLIQRGLGFEPNDITFYSDLEYIDMREKADEEEERLNQIEKEMETNSNALKNIKFDFIALSGIFIAILTIVIRMVTFDYKNFEAYDFTEIVKYQLAINLPWMLSLIIVIIVLLIISFKK